ncbi:hypothetical protein M422DRAFT_69303 [Sphaerobolus stellatus SS14]|uniref:Unplaced genomic scaffold SPHSTscaffold_94, whole genome shotgun sequence n=1 Tax=Sphaerobolus stellatus (strain SS14) TaxID=990650 RepID=A0A0C9VII3_SPHS4|nr:hypothetical protein M422DRAFT_69303 [Sphaerobolus stellatus SS14]
MEGTSPLPAGSMDSITLGQLRSMVNSQPKPKQSYYDFRYEDEDTVFNELEEFYSYIEVSQVAENFRAWQGSFPGEWTKSSLTERKAHVERLLESLEHKDAEIRFTNARRLFYILQGTFGETTSSEHQLHWIIENCKVVRAANGTSIIVEAIKLASSKLDILSNLTDQEMAQFNMTSNDKQEFMEEVCTELSVYLGMLYFLLEVFKPDHEFGEELMSLDPPLPIYFINLLSSLKDRSAKGYPMKKLLLVMWKTLLTTCGGIRELARCKKISRELCGLSPEQETSVPVKSSPADFIVFRQETSVKYPTFSPAPGSEQPAATLAEAYSPIPVRPHYHHDNTHGFGQDPLAGGPYGLNRGPINPNSGPLPPTPIPTPPPPSPKPKKQLYQTDQNRPFVFPFTARSQLRNAKLVPFAIDEADRLYERHMHVGSALWQMAKTREEYILDESGLDSLPNKNDLDFATFITGVHDKRYSVVSTVGNNDEGETLADIALLDEKIAQADEAVRKAHTSGDRRKAQERKEDLIRLKRVESIYSATLPSLQGFVLVLLKLLLASVHATSNQPPPSAMSNNGFSNIIGQEPPAMPPPPPPTLEELDVMRHREITSKAVSAILMLMLQWFKVSHVMKFHHFGQLLLDSNCLLLILKMFGLQEVSTTVITKTDSPEHNFFRYCYKNFTKNPQPSRPEDSMLSPPPRQTVTKQIVLPNGQTMEEEVELLSNYSWRNFFTSINFVRIMQKLSKHRSHRIWLLVQYKSSAILKRMLKVQHQMLQIHVLKLLKSQVPYCGRKWRQSNMKVITSIYLNCRPDLRDEWLIGSEVEDVQGALAQEQALRTLIRFYNTKRYGAVAAMANQAGMHRRTSSQSIPPLEGLPADPQLANLQRSASGGPNIDPDVFPPVRSRARDPAIFLPYIPEDIAFEDEYEEYLHDLGLSDDHVAIPGKTFNVHAC